MIEFRTGDVLRSDAEALVNTVNCVGIMGRGVALQFKRAFPENFRAYQQACSRQQVQPGRMFVFETGYASNPKFVINFPTKRHWKGKSRMEDIEAGLVALVAFLRERKVGSVALPPLGSGLGGLHWPDVRRLIELAANTLPETSFTVFEPHNASEAERMHVTRAPKVPSMTPGRAALVGLIRRYLNGLLDPVVTLLELHKLMYFMQEAGEPLRLRYVKAIYGPFAENLPHVLRAIDGYFVSGYGDGGDTPDKEIALVPGASDEAERFLGEHPDARSRFDRVAALVDGFETPFGLELLSTVHWVVAHEGASTESVAQAVYGWGDRKRQFNERQIRLAASVLAANGWLESDGSVSGA